MKRREIEREIEELTLEVKLERTIKALKRIGYDPSLPEGHYCSAIAQQCLADIGVPPFDPLETACEALEKIKTLAYERNAIDLVGIAHEALVRIKAREERR